MEAVKLFNQEVRIILVIQKRRINLCTIVIKSDIHGITYIFCAQLTALYEIKPPISKAKMTSITKGAIRSIKYYKHVVQSVEKFIQKCRQLLLISNFIHFYTAKKIIIITRRSHLNIIIPHLIFNRPEYKIPGLYVIDSIVRQSRHQFGPDKDVFAPRFAKNIQLTFYHLYKCSEEEKVFIFLVSLSDIFRY